MLASFVIRNSLDVTFFLKVSVGFRTPVDKRRLLNYMLERKIQNYTVFESFRMIAFNAESLIKYMMVIKNRPSKMKFFGVKQFFSGILISKMDVKMNLRIITKNLAADSKIGFPLKIDFRADWTHESNPTAWELILLQYCIP